MSRIVGDSFFPEDVLDCSTSCDPTISYQDVCPERFSKLEKELVRGKGEMVGLVLLSFLSVVIFIIFGSQNVSTNYQLYSSRSTGSTQNSASSLLLPKIFPRLHQIRLAYRLFLVRFRP